jgi:hypothetical protein
VANEILTPRVPKILSERPFPFEIRKDRTLPKHMPLYKSLAIEPAVNVKINWLACAVVDPHLRHGCRHGHDAGGIPGRHAG